MHLTFLWFFFFFFCHVPNAWLHLCNYAYLWNAGSAPYIKPGWTLSVWRHFNGGWKQLLHSLPLHMLNAPVIHSCKLVNDRALVKMSRHKNLSNYKLLWLSVNSREMVTIVLALAVYISIALFLIAYRSLWQENWKLDTKRGILFVMETKNYCHASSRMTPLILTEVFVGNILDWVYCHKALCALTCYCPSVRPFIKPPYKLTIVLQEKNKWPTNK